MIRFDHAVVACTRRSAVEGVSLEVPEGQALAVIGRSGAGKSLLLAATAAATPLFGGDITVHGRSVRRDPAGVRRSVGYAPARPPGWPPCTVGEFLELAARAVGLVGKPLRSALGRALDVCDLGDRVAAPVDTVPDGAARMLLVARALLHDPQVLVLDDPFTGLDPFQRDALERIIADAHLMGRTVLAAIDDAAVPSCFTHLAVLTDVGVDVAGPNAVEAFSTARRFSYRLACPGRAEEAVRALLPLATDARAVDLDHVQATIDPVLVPGSRLVAAALAAGIPVEAAGFHPPWTAQLIR